MRRLTCNHKMSRDLVITHHQYLYKVEMKEEISDTETRVEGKDSLFHYNRLVVCTFSTTSLCLLLPQETPL